jgi:hypothetical protein
LITFEAVQHHGALVTTDWIKVPFDAINPLLQSLQQSGVLHDTIRPKKGLQIVNLKEYRLAGSSEIFALEVFGLEDQDPHTWLLSVTAICPITPNE